MTSKILAIAAAVASLVSAPASASGLTDLLGLSQRGTNTINSIRYNGCSYSPGLLKTVCQAQLALRIANDADQANRAYQRSRRDRATSIDMREARPDVTIRLSQLCQAGDDVACSSVTRWRKASQAYEAAREAQSGRPSIDLDGARTRTASAGISPVPTAIRDLCMRGDQVACQTAYDMGRGRR